MASDESYVRRTIGLAESAVESGNTPFGSLLVVEDEIVRTAENTTLTDDDIAAHPEFKLASWAATELEPRERAACTMYTSTEPCPMCASAIVYAGLDRVVYSVSVDSLADVRSDDVIEIPCAEVVDRSDSETTVEGPVLEDEGLAVHEAYF
ncbi:nucleoside deaminase [Natrinema hispanicum]|uniref:tRNA(Arg) A34 adenosine deaminase TadA n=1 Tax=Natrinema hispanicum TaxID=392421 RepID=A0A1G6PKM3_9EURY|nr:nucleoside deaminase [Natrinema hispanicum]SDC80066.1 tRNA(Arg) A34 adenosine deaminase TadA [Natrinema hispanicum]SET62909.1 tRNA(Arg) A34 adenosine deaminase TadA [Natrinema hispanicum]